MAYSFREGIPENFQPDFDVDIFYQQKHLMLQSPQGLHSFVMMDESNEQIKSLVHFHIRDDSAWSPLRSPYGSYISSASISEKELGEFVDFTESRLREYGVKSVLLKNPPIAYAPYQQELLQQVLLQHQYQLQLNEVSAIIPVTHKSFEAQLHYSEKRKLRRCKASNLFFTMFSLDHLSEIYAFIKTCKNEKGYELSMMLDELSKAFAVLPDRFFLTGVVAKGDLVAANISIKVNELILYNFYIDHSRSYNLLSPVVFLNEGLYQFCQQQGFRFLDLGTSMLQGVINTSLLNFKLRLGAQPSPKLTFVKNIS